MRLEPAYLPALFSRSPLPPCRIPLLPISPSFESIATSRRSSRAAAASGSGSGSPASSCSRSRPGIRCSRIPSPCRRRRSSRRIRRSNSSSSTQPATSSRSARPRSRRRRPARLEWLGVAEGSRVKAGDVIARIDNRDVVAQAQSAQANVKAAQAALQQAEVERQNAKVELKRSQDLVAKGFVSQSALDTASMRFDRAQAGVANAQANVNVAIASGAQRRRRRRLHDDPGAVRRRHPLQERQRRRPRDAVLVGDRFEGRRRHDGGHEHARGRGRCLRIEPRQDPGRAALRDHAGCAAGLALPRPDQPRSCRRSTGRRPR